jgi:tetratricopeptide (TPR) repeat protein/DNA-binding SARP family transcriptional activator
MSLVQFVLFGRARVLADGQVLRLRPITAAALARLLLAEGHLVGVTELRAAMWPGSAGTARRGDRVAVQKRISELRKLLDPDHPGEDSTVLLTDRGGSTAYRLVVGREQVDIFCFEDLVKQAHTLPPDRAAGLLQQALALWADRPLLDFRDRDFALGTVQRLEQLHTIAGRRLALASYAAGQPGEALALANVLFAAQPDDPDLRDLVRNLTPVTSFAPTITGTADGQVPRQLPSAIRGFAGRGRQLAVLDALLSQGTAQVAVISGCPGVGKTTLAVHWAHRVASQFPDGQLHVNLRGFSQDEAAMGSQDALRCFLNAFGLTTDGIPADPAVRVGLYRSVLADRRVLIVLDNARDAEQVRPLLPGSPGCFTVVTSRKQLVSLAVAEAAHLLTLEVLEAADARRLLADRLGVDRILAEPKATDEIIARCQGLPLALAVVAARAAAHPRFPLAVIADELRNPGDVLSALDATEPVAGVRAAFSWSYRQLSPAAARLFRLAALNPGPDISLPATAALAGLAEPVAHALLDILSAVHLLEETAPGRFMMHDLISSYAATLEDNEPERAAARRRLLTWYLHTADAAGRALMPSRRRLRLADAPPDCLPLAFSGYEQALHWCDVEQANLVAVINAADSSDYDDLTVRLTYALWDYFRLRQPVTDWADCARMGIQAARRLGDAEVEASMLDRLGGAYLNLRRFSEAADRYREALQICRELGDRRSEGAMLNNLGACYFDLGEPDKCVECFREAIHAARQVGDRHDECVALDNLGEAYRKLQRPAMAMEYHQQSLIIARETGDRPGEGIALDNLGEAFRMLGQPKRAYAHYQQALHVRRRAGDRYGEAETLHHLGDLSTGSNPEAARRSWNQALAIYAALGDPRADELRDHLQGEGDGGTTSGA